LFDISQIKGRLQLGMNLLNSGKTTFKMEVPYRLYENGEPGPKPLIVYLHGFGQDINRFEKQTQELHSFKAYHLYIQGPYPDNRTLEREDKRGYAWYLYGGKKGSLEKSLEYSSEFIQGVIDSLIPFLKITRCAVIGYSMGGYQAGFFGFTRWKHTNELVMVGARFMDDMFKDRNWQKRKHLNILAVHGTQDEIVSCESQKKSILAAQQKGLNASITTLKKDHKLSKSYLDVVRVWLTEHGYQQIDSKLGK
jgi:predicted esterase